MRLGYVFVAFTLMACSKPVTAMQACEQLVKAGVGASCHSDTPSGLGGAALERVEFDLPSVAGEHGVVLLFQTDADYETTVASYQNLAALSGPHRYGNAKRRIFVQENRGLSGELGMKTKAVVDAL